MLKNAWKGMKSANTATLIKIGTSEDVNHVMTSDLGRKLMKKLPTKLNRGPIIYLFDGRSPSRHNY